MGQMSDALCSNGFGTKDIQPGWAMLSLLRPKSAGVFRIGGG